MSQLMPKYKEKALSTGLNLSSSNLKVVLVDTGTYTFSSSHDNLDDVDSGARVATSGNLSGKSVTNGVFDADDVTFTSVPNTSIEAMYIFYDSGTESTSTLIAYFDSATGLPITVNSSDIVVQWHASGIFAL